MTPPPLAPPVSISDYFELRLYQMQPGRLPGFHPLMRDVALPLFARHAIPAPLAMWEGFAGSMAPLYAYIIPWASLDARMDAWRAFYADPDWRNALAESYATGQRVERSHVFILRPSPVWDGLRDPGHGGAVGGLHEIAFHDVLNQDAGLAHASLARHDLPFLQRRGAHVLGVFATWFGTRANQAITITAWPDAQTHQAATRALFTDAAIAEAHDAERRAHGRPLIRSSDVHLVKPLDYAPAQPNLAPRG